MTIDAARMHEATRLTRAGRLQEATALLQGHAPAPSGTTAQADTTGGDPLHLLNRVLPKAFNPSDLRSAHTPMTGAPNSAQRPFRLHVPAGLTGPAPLVVMLHGGTQDAAAFEAATGMNALADEHGFIVVYPEQLASANPMRYWNWFDPADQQRDGGEPAIIVGIVRDLIEQHPVDPSRVYVAGFSAGAAMASILAATYPDVFAAVGVHSGLAYRSAGNLAWAMSAMRSAPAPTPAPRPVPVIVFHGDADSTVDLSNARAVLDQFAPADVARVSTRGRAGREYTRVSAGDAGELWTVHGAGHAWSGGTAGGSYTDPSGPNASAEFVRFFSRHRTQS